ncbi:MAG: ribbon-helix-helix domain-containing protein [Actinobacteria bacterium]|nr:ribbon-helix-helix domain-containing protein [Actinomycetota bacterium]
MRWCYARLTMKKTMMYLPEELHRYLAREAESRGTSMAEIAREAIAEYRTVHTEERAVSVSALVGCIEDDRPETDLALHVDDGLTEFFAPDGAWERENRP